MIVRKYEIGDSRRGYIYTASQKSDEPIRTDEIVAKEAIRIREKPT